MLKNILSNAGALVFDLDDTLYPEMDYVHSGFRVVAGRLAGENVDTEEIYQILCKVFDSGERRQVFNVVLEQLHQEPSEQVIAELVGVYRCHRPMLQLDEAVRNTLLKLRDKYKLGLITDGFLPAQRLKVEALILQNAFDHIIYTEQLGRQYWKPSLKPFEMMEQILDCRQKECVYIADNPAKDFVGPNKLGWRTIQVKLPDWIHADSDTAPEGRAEMVINAVNELQTAFS